MDDLVFRNESKILDIIWNQSPVYGMTNAEQENEHFIIHQCEELPKIIFQKNLFKLCLKILV